ncbi:MAG: ABC transporter substrate-binding protein [Cytophagaceae bacterium]|nr:ABC transporter substrate-binding protein [Cytophagaceae bacterium]
MKNSILAVVLASIFLGGCNDSKDAADNPNALVEAKGGKYYGGVFVVNESDYIKNLFPHNMVDAISYRVASQVYEGLMKFEQKDLSLKPAIAESYTVDSSQTVYTFKLRKGVFFHDDKCFDGKGRELTSEDVKFCFTLLCTPSSNNQGFSCFDNILKGAHEYYEAAKNGKPSFEVEGIKVIDPYTIQFTLVEPNSIFLNNLARPFTFIFPKEAHKEYGLEMRTKAVGTGPFQIQEIQEGNVIVLKKNPNYYLSDADGNKLPYLNGIKVKFLREKKSELLEFKKGQLNMMYRMPTDYIIEIEESTAQKKGEFGEYELQRTPEMATHFLGFLNTSKAFTNKNLRKAVSFAIDRKKILDAVLSGEGYWHGIYGLTPLDAYKGYDVKKIRGYDLNMDSAVYYLRKAGYRNGADVPTINLELNSDGERHIAVAEEIKKQLKDNLNITVNINVVTLAQLVENMQSGKSEFFRAGWFADYPSPENFLWFFYGKNVPTSADKLSYPNLTRYVNPEFDKYYEAGLHSKTQEEAYENFLKAEQIAMADAPIIVLWYDEGYRLLQANVKGLDNNAMQYRDFTSVFFVPKK